MKLGLFSLLCAAGAASASVSTEEIVTLPTAAAYGGGDTVGSKLIGRTYNGGNGPGIWITADGGYRLYLNGELLAQDNAAGRVTFVPVTFLPGENAVSVVGADGNGAPGVLVQIDELDTTYYSGSGWYAKAVVSNAAWKAKGRDLSQWGGATVSGSASTTPSGKVLSGFASGSGARWIWTNSSSDTNAILLFTFNIKAEGFGASTTGGNGGVISILSDSAAIRKALQDTVTRTILIPEGTYDFRLKRNAVTEATASGYTWCSRKCGSSDANSSNTFYRINFKANSCKELDTTASIVSSSAGLMRWDNWITTKPNKSVVGMGRGAALRGVAFAMRSYEGAKNQIYRNLALYDVNPHLIEAGDGLEASGASGSHTSKLWADHISYKWVSDGMDMEYVDSATISWLDYDGHSEYNCYEQDPYVSLVEDAMLTYTNDYWHATYGRVPKIVGVSSGAKVHLYNNYVDTNYYFVLGTHGNTSSAIVQALYENNYLNHINYALVMQDSNSKVMWSGNTVANSGNAKYYLNDVASTTIPVNSVFTPGYSYVKKTVSSLPTLIPAYAGMGGKWGSMPAYDQSFGKSHAAPTVTLTVPSGKVTGSVTLAATASATDGSIASVAFYAGTQLLGTASSSPYFITASGMAAGTYSVIAVATDSHGLTRVSDYALLQVESSATTEVRRPDLAGSISPVQAHVTWLNAGGEVIGQEVVLVDPAHLSLTPPAGVRGLAFARVFIAGMTPRTVRVPRP